MRVRALGNSLAERPVDTDCGALGCLRFSVRPSNYGCFHGWSGAGGFGGRHGSGRSPFVFADDLAALTTRALAAQRVVAGYVNRLAGEAAPGEARGCGAPVEEMLRGGGAVSTEKAKRLGDRAGLGESMPQVGAGVDGGQIRGENADVLAEQLRRLDRAQRATLGRFEQEIARQAAWLPPETFTRWLSRLVRKVSEPDDDAALSEAERQRVASAVWLKRQPDGMWRLSGDLDDERGTVLHDVLTRTARRLAPEREATASARADALFRLATRRPPCGGPTNVSGRRPPASDRSPQVGRADATSSVSAEAHPCEHGELDDMDPGAGRASAISSTPPRSPSGLTMPLWPKLGPATTWIPPRSGGSPVAPTAMRSSTTRSAGPPRSAEPDGQRPASSGCNSAGSTTAARSTARPSATARSTTSISRGRRAARPSCTTSYRSPRTWHHVNPSGSWSCGGAEPPEVSGANDADRSLEVWRPDGELHRAIPPPNTHQPRVAVRPPDSPVAHRGSCQRGPSALASCSTRSRSTRRQIRRAATNASCSPCLEPTGPLGDLGSTEVPASR